MKIIREDDPFFSVHSHSKFSANDALSSVEDMVKTVKGYRQRALGLTDHGNMAGSVQLYRHCSEAGIKPFPGTELYVVPNREDKKAKRHHMCVVAYTTQGYENLVRLNTKANENFYHKPLIDHNDMAELSEAGGLEGIAGTSGCFFGLIAQSIVRGDEQQALQLMKSYDSWFGQFYVELQNHNITHDEGSTDDELAESVWKLAESVGIPAILTQDSHYCHLSQKHTHETMKRLVSFGQDSDDAVFPGDGFHLADKWWMEAHHHDKRYEAGLAGLEHLFDSHDLSIPQLDSYSYNVPFTVENPQSVLETICAKELESRGLSLRYLERMKDELAIVKDTGMAGYLLLVSHVTSWCKENHVFYQARGSASGSILCWLLKITQVDPLEHKLRFERFISRDRTKPPDIDLDVEHTRREEIIEWLKSRFSISQIGTWLSHSLHQEEDGGKGSLAIKYYTKKRGSGNPIGGWDDVPDEDKKALYELANHGAYSGYGVHAAGLVVTTNDAELHGVVPQMKVASSKTMVTQYDMGDIESMGFVKLDLLGLKSLSILNACIENLGREDLDWIPLRDKATYQSIARGDTGGVFQLEGWTARNGVKRLKPTKLSDVIASMALFRPATMKSGTTDSYINRKFKQEEIPERHDIIMGNTKDTFGLMIFQEQVIGVLRDLGMNPDDLTAFLKAVKASNASVGDAAEVIANYETMLHEMAEAVGMNQEDWDWMWHAIESFASYGFNKCVSFSSTLTYAYDMSHNKETQLHRAGASQYNTAQMTVEEYYNIFHGFPCPVRSKYRDPKRGLKIAAHKDGKVVLDRVTGVTYMGVQPVYELKLESGHSIKATVNHRHLTKRGWVEQFDITTDDEVATMGDYEIMPVNGMSKSEFYGPMGIDAVRKVYASLPKECEECGSGKGRLEVAHLDHDRTNNTRENLKRLCNSCHKEHDCATGRRTKRWQRGRSIVWSKVVSNEYAGDEDTYDIEMEGDDHSWVGNGIVTHNSHAAAYGLTAYRCAYLKTHHPTEFFAAVLAIWAGDKKERQYIREARGCGVSIRSPHVNESLATYAVSPKGVRKGLLAIKGVGPKVADLIIEKRPDAGYDSLEHFCRQVGSKVSGVKAFLSEGDDSVGVLSKLIDAEVFGGLDQTAPSVERKK